MTRQIDHKQIKTREANTGDILRVTGADDLSFVDPNSIVIPALTAGNNIVIEANGLIIGTTQAFSGNSDVVPEGTSNLYFTNDRVLTAIEEAPTLITGNIIPAAHDTYNLGNATHRWGIVYVSSGTISIGNLYLKESPGGQLVVTTNPANTESDAGLVDLTTDDILESSANLYFTNARAIAAVVDNIDTSNVAEGANLYFTNARAIAAVIDNIDTSNVAEGANLYFTNTRAVGSLTGGTGITIEANGLLVASGEASTFTGTTDGVVEGTSNLYFTNARVYANVAPLLDELTTDDITEGSNLYFTNTRAVGALTGGDNITIEANGLIVGQPGYSDGNALVAVKDNISTSNVYEGDNLYFTNARVEGFINDNITTSNVAEGSNLYFTNTRAVGSLTGGTGIAIEANGLVTATGDSTPVFDTVETGDLTVTGNLIITGNTTTISANILQIDDPLVHLAANNEISDVVDFGWLGHYSPDSGTTKQHAGIFRKHGSNSFYIFSQYVDEDLDSGNLVTNIDTANNTFRLANVHASVFVGELQGNATGSAATVDSISDHDTDDLPEGTANLYFTNTRAIGSLTAGAGIVINANGLVQSTGEAGTFTGTTDGIAEGTSNLYFTNARVYANVAPLLDALTTDDIEEGSNLYFTNTRAVGSLTAGEGIEINANGLLTANLAGLSVEASNIFATDIQVSGNVIANGLVVNGFEILSSTSAGDINANTITANGWVGLYTSNVIESGNLYFTNTRAVGALTGGAGIEIESNGLITSNIEAAYVIVESSTYIGDGTTTQYTLTQNVTANEQIIITVDGLLTRPTIDYGVSGNVNLQFVSAPHPGANIEVRHYGTVYATPASNRSIVRRAMVTAILFG